MNILKIIKGVISWSFWDIKLASIVALSFGILFFPIDNYAQSTLNQELDLELYLEYETVSKPMLSPDGKFAVYQRHWIDKVNDKRKTDIWTIDLESKSTQRLIKNGALVGWSPNGDKVLFTKEGDPRGTQLFLYDIKEKGYETQITRVDRSPSNITWSPDGKYIAFTMIVPEGKDEWDLNIPFQPMDAKWTNAPLVVDDYDWRTDRQGIDEKGKTEIFIVESEGGTPIQVTDDDWDNNPQGDYLNPYGGISWSKDGGEILFSALREQNAERQFRQSEIYAVNIINGDVRQLTKRVGLDYDPHVSPNNKMVAYLGFEQTRDNYYVPNLSIVNVDGSNEKELAPNLDRRAEIVNWADDNSGIYLNVEEKGTSNLYFVSINGDIKQVTEGNHMLEVSDISEDFAIGVKSSPKQSPDVISFNLSNPNFSNLTSVNSDIFNNITLSDVEEIWYESTDGLKIQGWVVKPPNFDSTKEYPLILTIHGGPEGMFDVGFNYTYQYHAANGYVVLYTNPRGSGGYGKSFGTEIKNDYPNKDFDDLMNGVDEVVSRGYIDTKNMFVYGGSGGGVLTAWTIAHTDRFAAASSNYPVTNWMSFVGTTDLAWWHTRFEKPFWEDPSEHLRRSPIMYVENVKTPTMLFIGVKDLRTPVGQTEEYYQALKRIGVPTMMVRFNDEFHGTSSNPSNYIRSQMYLHKWFAKWEN